MPNVIGSQWSTQDVSDWLEQMGFKQYISKFKNQKIDGAALLNLDADALYELNVNVGALLNEPFALLMLLLDRG